MEVFQDRMKAFHFKNILKVFHFKDRLKVFFLISKTDWTFGQSVSFQGILDWKYSFEDRMEVFH